MIDHLPPKEMGCHCTGFRTKCRKLVVSGTCKRWIQISGVHPNTGEPINRYDCVDNWMPVLLMENTVMVAEQGAAVESHRNVMRQVADSLLTNSSAKQLEKK